MSSSASPGYPAQTQAPPTILPPEKVFPIQIGSELFRLSGASIASDAPSYFSQFFEEQLRQNGENSTVRTLYIDRDPDTFRDILKHLQGYYIRPRDNSHFVKLFADSQFYSLPRLISQLFECEIFIQIGDRHFEIPRDIFSSPGDSPNFFSLGFAVFFATPGEVFPGLDRQGLLRPPAITPPIVSNRSGDVFAELLHMLRGYPIHIRNEEHRAELLRDCRYFHLRGLEQKLIAHHISYNFERQKSEIVIRLEDIRPSGLLSLMEPASSGAFPAGWVQYARPFVDDNHHELILEIGGESTQLDVESQRAKFSGLTKARISSLLQVIANKTSLSTNGSQAQSVRGGQNSSIGNHSRSTTPGSKSLGAGGVKIEIDPEADIILDGEPSEPPRMENLPKEVPTAPYRQQSWSHGSTRTGNEHGELQNLGLLSMGADFQPPNFTPHDANDGSRHDASYAAFSAPFSQPTLHPSMSGARVPTGAPVRKRKRNGSVDISREWTVRKGHWRVRVQQSCEGGIEVVLVALKLDAFTGQRSRNIKRSFLDSM